MPPKLAFDVDYWLPDPRLDGLVSGYHRYAIEPAAGERHRDVFFPGWANMRFHVAGEHWRVRLGDDSFDVPRTALFGPTSKAGYSEGASGIVVGAGITPLGWYRLNRGDAVGFADRIAPLAELIGSEAAPLATAAAAPREDIKARFDTIFLRLLDQPRSDEARVAQVHRYLMDPGQGGVAEMAARLGLSHRTLNRVARAAFGFGPKLLVRRARFLRSLMALRGASASTWASRIESSYYDHSHFNRDAQEFLGMSPGEFMRLPKPLNDASARLRMQILGAPAQALLHPRLTEPARASKGSAGRHTDGDSVRPLDS
ncbi:helix-turn-helix domain-containing protein [Sphingomonas sp. MAH-20]|uniref:Helix-turn-helix domain-containing protein n=1 Tax=Sphingomonas horti TaxID=2682842 RepID=A0A6I4J2I5_9SPHN|nr:MULTISPECIES: helix-turn-helix domain-containing protein [Sphingomonas]MBA2918614.1 AraC family transcriptional regulator [Sphingomonas sp. CGMCC 1.13658]MVO78645.1 helix-turn-helix domain-containing protein [Sphingomonas horti]